MKRVCTFILLVLLATVGSKAQGLDRWSQFSWMELYERSLDIQADREARLRAAREQYQQARDEVDDYNSSVEILKEWMKLTDLKYQQLHLKYVNRVNDVKLAAAIRTLQKDLQERMKKLK